MSARHRVHAHYSSSLLQLHSYECHEDDRCFGKEETAGEDCVAFVRRGAFEIRSRGIDQLVDANSLVLFRAGETYRSRHPIDGGDVCTVLTPSPHVMASIRAACRPITADSLSSEAIAVIPSTARLFHAQQLALLHTTRDSDPCAIEEIGIAIAASSWSGVEARSRAGRRKRASGRSPARSSTRREHADLVEDTKRLLAARFAEPMALEAIAAAVHSSPFHLARVFRAATGSTLHRWRNRLRLRYALLHLPEYRRDLIGLALDSGFSSHSHFTSAFTAEFDCPPGMSLKRCDRSALLEMSAILKARTPGDRRDRPR